MLRKKAPASGIKDLGSKMDKPGLIIISTPIKPTKIAIHVFKETCSLNIMADKATTKTGVKEAMLWASASVKYLKDKIKHPDSIIDKILRKSWILILPDL